MQSNSVPLNSEIVLEPYPLPGFHLMQWSQDWSVRSPQDQPQPTHWRLGNISGLYLTLTTLMHRNLRSLMTGVLRSNRTGFPVIPSLYGVCHRWQQMSWLNWRASRSDRFWRKSGRNESVRSRESEQTFWLTSENERSHRKELFSVAPIQMDRSMKNLALTFVKNFMPRRMLQSHRPLGYVYKKQTKEILN